MRPTRRLRPALSTRHQIELGVFVVVLVAIALRVWLQPAPVTEQIQFREELRVAFVEHALGRSDLADYGGREQLELELLDRLAERLGVSLEVRRVERPADVHALLRAGRVDLGAGLLVPPGDDAGLRRGPEILEVQRILAYWQGSENGGPLLSPMDIPAGSRIGVPAGASLPPMLHRPHREDGQDDVATTAPHEVLPLPGPERMRDALERGEIDFALMTSLEYRRLQRLHPELRAGYELAGTTPLVWLFPDRGDTSLEGEAGRFLQSLRETGELERLLDRYLGHLETHDLVDTLTFERRVHDRLERFRDLFEDAGEKYNLDWRFIAAVAYQESHWNPDAVSPTGVRGLMMLTRATAQDLGIPDRTDPQASVDGGTRYLLQMRERLPESIPEPDRTWMTLAAYNVGLGHVNDARALAANNGDDPDRWVDVKEWLPRLAESRWYEQTRHGYARGWEPVSYTRNIRSYYDKLMQRFPEPGDRVQPPAPGYRNTPLAL